MEYCEGRFQQQLLPVSQALRVDFPKISIILACIFKAERLRRLKFSESVPTPSLLYSVKIYIVCHDGALYCKGNFSDSHCAE
jgi:hypothetical protein